MQDGIRPFISVGYRVNEVVLEKQSDDEGNTYRVTRLDSGGNFDGRDSSGYDGRSRALRGREDVPRKGRSLITKSAPKPQTTTTTEAGELWKRNR